MATYWTIENAGTEQTLEAWGLDRVTAAFASQAADGLQLWSAERAYDAAYLFAYKSNVIVRRDRESTTGAANSFSGGAGYFSGIVAHPSLRASGRSEGQGCIIIGPWWYLEERGFKQSYNAFVSWTLPAAPVYETKYTSHIFLNNALNALGDPTVTKINSGAQILEALNWALKPFVDAAAAPPFQIGTVDLAVDPPIDEVKNITCAEVIRKMLRWSPDAVAWFDHSTTPPTFHCRRRANLTAFNLDTTTQRPMDINIVPRHDLQRPYIHIQYERINTINGAQFLQVIDDIYPNPAPTAVIDQFAGVPFVLDLRGSVSNSQSVTIECATINAASSAWWLDHLSELKSGLANGRLASVTIDPASVRYTREDGSETSTLPWPRELKGLAADWVPATFERLTVTVKATVVSKNGHTQPDRTLSFALVATDANSGTYSTNAGSSSGDPIPVNLAKDMYDALSVLQFEGALEFQKQELGNLPKLGHKLNLLGTALAGLDTMQALVYRVSEDVFTRTTQIEFGPPSYLNAGDLVSLFHVSRNRLILNSPLMRNGYTGGGSGTLGSRPGRENSSSADGNPLKIVASGSTDPGNETDVNKQGVVQLHGGQGGTTIVYPSVTIYAAPANGSFTMKAAPNEGTFGQEVKGRWTRGCDPLTGAPRYCVMPRSNWIENLPPGANADE